MTRAILRDAAVFAFFLGLAVAVTWPLAANLATVLVDLGDSALNTWILDWVCHALLNHPFRLYEAPMFHPDRYPLAYSENLVGIALVMLPFRMAGLSPVALHNLALILGFATSGFAAYLLARLVTRKTAPSITGGIIYGFASLKLDHLEHLQIVWSAWLPLLLAALLLYWRSPRGLHSAFLGVAFAMNGLSNIYWLLMGGFALVLTIALLSRLEPRRGRAFWVGLIAPLAIASIVLVPFLLPYRTVSNLYRMRRFPNELRGFSATPLDWLRAAPENLLYGTPDPNANYQERRLFPGALALLLSAIALVIGRRGVRSNIPPASDRTRLLRTLDGTAMLLLAASLISAIAGQTGLRRALGTLAANPAAPMFSLAVPMTLAVALIVVRLFIAVPGSGRPLGAILRDSMTPEASASALWIAIGFAGSLGANAFLVPFLFKVVHPFRAMRAPSRWAILAYVGLAVWAAIGASSLLERTKRRRALGALLVALAAIEVAPRPLRFASVPQFSGVYEFLREQRPGVALEVPLSGGGEQALYLLASTIHHQPILNGASGFEAPTHDRLRRMWEAAQLDDAFLDLTRAAGASIVIVHRPLLGDRQQLVDSWLAAGVGRGRLRFLRAFGEDHVYEIVR